MTLRKAILNIILIVFFALMYTILHTYVILTDIAETAGTGLSELIGGFNALVIWLQFPLLFLLSLLLIYLAWGDKSLSKTK
jgi:hypothetical protein